MLCDSTRVAVSDLGGAPERKELEVTRVTEQVSSALCARVGFTNGAHWHQARDFSLELPLGVVAVATGLVASLAQRGGNLTGASIMVVELMASR